MAGELTEDDDLGSIFGRAKARILKEVSYSPMTIDELSHLIGINRNAVKEHLDSLELKGYVNSSFQKARSGRPKKLFELTEKGMDLFPKRYASLASLLIDEIREEIGVDGLNNMLAKVAGKIARKYNIDNVSMDAPGERVEGLKNFVNALNRMGYSAKLVVDGDSVKIVRYNCIFYDVAKGNAGAICGSLGNEIVRGALGPNFSITEKFSAGDRKCVVELKV